MSNENGETFTNEYTHKDRVEILRKTEVPLSSSNYNNLVWYSDSVLPSNLPPYNKQQMRKKISLLYYVQNDFLKKPNELTGELELTDKLIFETSPSDWEMKN